MNEYDHDAWDRTPRAMKLANVMYQHLADEKTRALMDGRLRNEGRKLAAKPEAVSPYARGACSPLGGRAK